MGKRQVPTLKTVEELQVGDIVTIQLPVEVTVIGIQENPDRAHAQGEYVASHLLLYRNAQVKPTGRHPIGSKVSVRVK